MKSFHLILSLMIMLQVLSDTYPKSVAIIGAGIGGSSAARYLLSNSNISQVDIYERRHRVGGRVYSENILNETTNFGASFLLKENQLIYSMVKEMNLTTERAGAHDNDGTLGIFNNKTILLNLGTSDILDIIKVIWRYGLLSPLRAKRIIKERFAHFNKIYDLLKGNVTFGSLGELLNKTDTLDLIYSTIGEILEKEGVSKKYVEELYNAVVAGIYNQHTDVNAYAGFIALVAESSSTKHIVGGNDLLIKRINEENQKTGRFNLYLNKTVTQILKASNGYYILDETPHYKFYDYIIIACPLNKTNIEFKGLDISAKNYYPNNFVAPYSAIVRGTPRPEYFSWKKTDKLPDTLISNNIHNGIVFLMALYKENVYRLESEQELSPELLEGLGYFEKGVEFLKKFHWDFAYPAFQKFNGAPEDLPDFILDEGGLYYINAIEAAGSCMEVSMISARNIVNMIEKRIAFIN